MKIQEVGETTTKDGVVHLSKEILEDGILIIRIPSDRPEDLDEATKTIHSAIVSRGINACFLVVPYSTEILKVSQDRLTILEKIWTQIDKFLGRILY